MRPPLCLTVAAYAKRRSALELSEHSWNTNRELIGSLSFLLGKEVNSGKARGKGQQANRRLRQRGYPRENVKDRTQNKTKNHKVGRLRMPIHGSFQQLGGGDDSNNQPIAKGIKKGI